MLACAACGLEVAMDRFPFMPVWAILFLLWLGVECETQGSRLSILQLFAAMAFGLALVLIPSFSMLVAMALVVWSICLIPQTWVLIVRSKSSDEVGPPRKARRHLHYNLILIIALAASASVGLWLWDRPVVAVRRLGSGRMAVCPATPPATALVGL